MSCESWNDFIALAVGGNLSSIEAAALERHLRSCAACRRYAEEIAASQQALRRFHRRPLDSRSLDRIRDGVLQRMADGDASGIRWLRRPRPAVRWLALAASLILAVSLWQIRQLRQPEPEPRREEARRPRPESVAPPAGAPPATPTLPEVPDTSPTDVVPASRPQPPLEIVPASSRPDAARYPVRPSLVEFKPSNEPLEASPRLVVLPQPRPQPSSPELIVPPVSRAASAPGPVLLDLTASPFERPTLRRLLQHTDYTIYWLEDPADTLKENENADTTIL